MKVTFILLYFLLILLVPMLSSVTNRFFFCYFRLSMLTMRKIRLNTVYTNDGIQQERLPISLEVGRIYF